MARRTIVEIDRRSLRRFERAMTALGDVVVPHASRDGATEAGRRAQVLLQAVFRRDIQGGPAPATRVRPGSPSSSVLVDESEAKSLSGDEVAVRLAVSRRAARWLQFQLGDKRNRRPGYVGVARKANFVPQEKALKVLMRTRLPFGNLPRGYLRRLVALTGVQSASDEGVFYGVPRGTRRPRGFYRRTGRGSAPQLLVAAARQSRYRGNEKLQRGWNVSVEQAGGRMSADVALRIMREVRRMGRSPV